MLLHKTKIYRNLKRYKNVLGKTIANWVKKDYNVIT